MRATRVSTLLACAVVAALASYLLARLAYGALPPLPAYAPVTMLVLAAGEGVVARVVRDRVTRRRTDARGRPVGRPLHPLQVARAAVLAKASSPTGAVLLGGYAGFLAWTFPRRALSSATARDSLVCAASVVSALLLVVAALHLERACRTPSPPDLQSPT